VNQDKGIQSQLASSNTTYIINTPLDLKGKTINLPQGCTLLFSDGSIANGMLNGRVRIKGEIVRNSLNVRFSKDSSIDSYIPIYNYASDVVASQLQACSNGCYLAENIYIDKSVYLRSSIEGKNHSISISENLNTGFYITDSKKAITISNVKIVKQIESNSVNKNYVLFAINSSNITVDSSIINGRLFFVNKTKSDDGDKISKNIKLTNCELNCDLSKCPQGWEYAQDHLSFFSIKKIKISNCKINSINVNRVIKTSAYFSENKYDEAINCTDGVLFENNEVNATSSHGKQLWDMYCGTVNVVIKGNFFSSHGFSQFIEDKAYQFKYKKSKPIQSTIRISNNVVELENSSIFQFKANAKNDRFIVTGNEFTVYGSNLNNNTGNNRTCGIYLQGYKSCIIDTNAFTWKDEAIGMLLAMVNFDCNKTVIRNNTITDAYRIYFCRSVHPVRGLEQTVCDKFSYSGNTRYYTPSYKEQQIELFVSDAAVRKLNVCIENKSDSSPIILQKGTVIETFSINTKCDNPQLINKASKDVYIGSIRNTTVVKPTKNGWAGIVRN
jgi:hypothetical protein